MKITLIKTLNGSFKPAYDTDYEKAKKIKPNEPYEFEYKKPRNYEFHKKFFALVNLVYQNQEQYTNAEHLRKDLLIEAGYYDTRYNLQGIEIQEAKSISFAAIDEIEFNEIYSAVVDAIVKNFHFDKEDILLNVEQFF